MTTTYSSAYGSFSFEEGFYNQNKELIDAYFDRAELRNTYGIDVEGHEGVRFGFDGTGYESMQKSLPWVLSPVCIKDEELSAGEKGQVDLFRKLYALMIVAHTRVTFEYTDMAIGDGFGFYVRQKATIIPDSHRDGSDLTNFFLVESCTTEDLGYNDRNIINAGYENGYDLHNEDDVKYLKDDYLNNWYRQQGKEYQSKYSLDCVIEALKKLANDSPTYNGAIAEWRFDDDCGDVVREATHNATGN